MMCQNSDLFDVNGQDKLSENCIADREDIIRHHAKNPLACFFLGTSGGKDSQAAYAVVKRLVPAERIFVIHATLGAVEHDGVIEHIESTIDHDLHIVRNKRKDFIDMVLLRGMFPSSQYRQCTSDLKTNPIDMFIRAHMKKHGFTHGFNVTGLRSEESTQRAMKNPLWINKRLSLKSGVRTVFDWMPIFHYSEQDVYEEIANADQVPHKAYGDRPKGLLSGNSRLSCIFCIMGSKNDLINGAVNYHNHYHEMIALEMYTNHSMFGKSKVVHSDIKHPKGTQLSGGVVTQSELNNSKRAILPYKNKVFMKVSLSEKTGVPVDELLVQRYIAKHKARHNELNISIAKEKQETAKLKAEKAAKSGSKNKKRDRLTIDFIEALA